MDSSADVVFALFSGKYIFLFQLHRRTYQTGCSLVCRLRTDISDLTDQDWWKEHRGVLYDMCEILFCTGDASLELVPDLEGEKKLLVKKVNGGIVIMKKLILWGAALFLGASLILTHRLEPELRVYPLAMGFDIGDEGYQVWYDLPELSVYTGEGKPMETGERIWYFQGQDQEEIADQITRGKKQTPDMGHVQTVLLSKNLMQDQQKYKKVLTSFVQEPMLGSSAYVFVVEQMEEIMTIGAQTTDSLGAYLVDLMDKSEEKPVILQDLYNACYNQGEEVLLPEIYVEQNEIMVKNW